MARIHPVSPPHNPRKVSVIWMNNSFRELVNHAVYLVAETRYPERWSATDTSEHRAERVEARRQLRAWGTHYIEWHAGKRVAPGQISKKTVLSKEDRRDTENAVDNCFKQHVRQLREALAEIDCQEKLMTESSLEELLTGSDYPSEAESE